MSEHEQWFNSLNANGKTIYFLGNEHKVSKMAWDFQQAKIERLEKCIRDALVCVDQAKDGYYGFSCEGGDTDNLAKHLEKALRGNSDQHLPR